MWASQKPETNRNMLHFSNISFYMKNFYRISQINNLTNIEYNE